MNEKMRKILTVVLAVVFVISSGLWINHSLDTAEAEDAYAEAQQLAVMGVPQEAEQEMLPTEEPMLPQQSAMLPQQAARELAEAKRTQTVWVPAAVEEDEYMKQLSKISLSALRAENPNVVGWIFLPNTAINYPIVQGEDNEHYLHYTWNNKKSVSGSIFLETTNASDFSDFRSILYGHNMADTSMFGALHRYSSADYWKIYPYVYLVTDEGVLRYEIYSSYNAEVTGKTYALDLDDRVKESFIRMTVDESVLETGIVPNVTDRLLTLSTCTGNYDYRRVVHARLVMVEETITDSPQERFLQ